MMMVVVEEDEAVTMQQPQIIVARRWITKAERIQSAANDSMHQRSGEGQEVDIGLMYQSTVHHHHRGWVHRL